MQSANDLLMGGGGKSASFPNIGDSITGRVASEPKPQQQTDVNTGQPKFFANGDPMMQVVVQLETDQRDPDDPDDDGVRNLYIKSKMLIAIREAVKVAGAKGLEPGGVLTVTYTANGERTNKAFNPPKLYAASYKPPTNAANSVLMGTTPSQSTQVPSGAVPTGVDSGIWAQLDATQRAGVLAAVGAGTDQPPF